VAGKNVDPNIEILAPPSGKAQPPAGCVPYLASPGAAVYLHVVGLIDIDAEVSKAKVKVSEASDRVKKQEAILGKMSDKVGEGIRDQERKRLQELEQDVRRYDEAVGELTRLKLE